MSLQINRESSESFNGFIGQISLWSSLDPVLFWFLLPFKWIPHILVCVHNRNSVVLNADQQVTPLAFCLLTSYWFQVWYSLLTSTREQPFPWSMRWSKPKQTFCPSRRLLTCNSLCDLMGWHFSRFFYVDFKPRLNAYFSIAKVYTKKPERHNDQHATLSFVS